MYFHHLFLILSPISTLAKLNHHRIHRVLDIWYLRRRASIFFEFYNIQTIIISNDIREHWTRITSNPGTFLIWIRGINHHPFLLSSATHFYPSRSLNNFGFIRLIGISALYYRVQKPFRISHTHTIFSNDTERLQAEAKFSPTRLFYFCFTKSRGLWTKDFLTPRLLTRK